MVIEEEPTTGKAAMITTDEVVTETIKKTYSAQAPDGTSLTATVETDVVTLTHGGSSLVVRINVLPVLTAMAATIAAGIEPVAAPEETPVEESA